MEQITINDAITLYPYSGKGVYTFESVDGIHEPPRRTSSANFAGRHGGVVGRQLYGQRLITVRGGIDELNCTDHLLARSELIANMPIDQSVPLRFHLANGKVMTAFCYFESPSMPLEWKYATDFQFVAITDDYRLFDTSAGSINSVTVNKNVSGGLRWDATNGLKWDATNGLLWYEGSGSVNAINNGTTDASPIITISGAVTNPSLFNQNTNETMAVNITTSASDVLVYDSLTKSLTLNGGNINALLVDPAATFTLQPGDNVLTFTTVSATGSAVVEWYDAYLGLG